VLLDRARELAQQLGWTETPRDEWSVLMFDRAQADGLARRFGTGEVVEHLRRFRGGTFSLLYRRSPRVLTPVNALAWSPTPWDPPLLEPGMLTLSVDGSGRLLSLESRPVDHDSAGAPAAAVAWPKLFAMAGLDTAAFRAVAPEWTPPAYADQRVAWLGRVPGDTALVLRIEGASYRGQPVMFRSIFPWTPVPSGAPAEPSFTGRVLPWVVWLLFLGLLALAVVAARTNLRAGRADARGALRMATGAAMLGLVSAWASTHYVNDPSLLAGHVLNTVARAGLLFLVTAALYLTLEPIVRRTWPAMLVSWVRLLDGRLRDSLLGRDLLAGLALGALMQLVAVAGACAWAAAMGGHALPEFIDSPGSQTSALMSTGSAITVVVRAIVGALQTALSAAALAALFTQVTKRRVPSLVLSGLVVMVIQAPGVVDGGYLLVLVPIVVAVALFAMVRFGFVAVISFLTAQAVLSNLPIVTPGSSWYWSTTAVGVVVLAGLALWCLRSMLAPPARAISRDDLLRSMRGPVAGSHAFAGGGSAARGAMPGPAAPSQMATEPSPHRPPSSQLPTELSPPPGAQGTKPPGTA
jgi:hypothetical protein